MSQESPFHPAELEIQERFGRRKMLAAAARRFMRDHLVPQHREFFQQLPFVVVGMNSIAIYLMSWTMESFVSGALDRHFGTAISVIAGPTFQPVLHGFLVMLIFWLILFWMYRRRIFLRI